MTKVADGFKQVHPSFWAGCSCAGIPHADGCLRASRDCKCGLNHGGPCFTPRALDGLRLIRLAFHKVGQACHSCAGTGVVSYWDEDRPSGDKRYEEPCGTCRGLKHAGTKEQIAIVELCEAHGFSVPQRDPILPAPTDGERLRAARKIAGFNWRDFTCHLGLRHSVDLYEMEHDTRPLDDRAAAWLKGWEAKPK